MPIFIQMGLPGEDRRLKGPVKEPPHVDWFEVSGVQWGVSQHLLYGAPRSGSSREPGQPQSELVIRLRDNEPLLFQTALDGRPVTVVVDFVGDGQSSMVLVLRSVLVSSYSLSGNELRSPPASITLNFTDIDMYDTPASVFYGPANPVGEILPLMVLRHLVNVFTGL